MELDITKMQNHQAARYFAESMNRGARQIIQGTFIGETGAWAHNGWLKLLTQFRTFSIVAIDKQWNRRVGTEGWMKACGLLLGTMSFAAPIVDAFGALSGVVLEESSRRFATHPLDPVLDRTVRPVWRRIHHLALRLRPIQQGRLVIYLLYVMSALLVLLAWLAIAG